jgi:hypothetical protein
MLPLELNFSLFLVYIELKKIAGTVLGRPFLLADVPAICYYENNSEFLSVHVSNTTHVFLPAYTTNTKKEEFLWLVS